MEYYGAVFVVVWEVRCRRAVKATLFLGYKIAVQVGMDGTLLWNNLIYTRFFTVLPFEWPVTWQPGLKAAAQPLLIHVQCRVSAQLGIVCMQQILFSVSCIGAVPVSLGRKGKPANRSFCLFIVYFYLPFNLSLFLKFKYLMSVHLFLWQMIFFIPETESARDASITGASVLYF